MSHIVGTVQAQAPAWSSAPTRAPLRTRPTRGRSCSTLRPRRAGHASCSCTSAPVSLPASNRLEVDLGYGTDVFTSADGDDFWTRPFNVSAMAGGVRIRYVTNGAANGGAHLAEYGRGERHAGDLDGSALSNCDPFLTQSPYSEPIYDPFWFCNPPPNWENAACVTAAGDIRAQVARAWG